ncbi:keratin, type I cytoskeletal 9-like isoform X1 [Daphnia carinata]|uniref:keratin, type I cytoskeletal 9-like isoform X1 n=1 Tax=Daphnia carinata TaxID=120202 RepID=UPI002579F283|nr:keratin, type I cytoskeletal 9-like isoform X1 [Daphnia carinata]
MRTWLTAVLIIATLSGSSGTYDASDAWRQMSGLTDHSATFSAMTSHEEGTSSPISSRAADSKAAASSYGGGGYGGGSYGHGGGGYGHGGASYGGGYGHGGGGGYGQGGSYLNTSAVSLLGFLYLLNLIQDILNQITTTTAAATGRKKRAISDPFQEWFTNLGQGGIQTLTYEVAATILPLLNDFTEHHDLQRPLVCFQRSVCSANRRLVSNYGQLGKVFGKLGSEAVLERFQSFYPEGTFTEAAIHGRNLADCYKIYNECKLD